MNIRVSGAVARRSAVAVMAVALAAGLTGCAGITIPSIPQPTLGAWPWSDSTAVPTTLPTHLALPVSLPTVAPALPTALPTALPSDLPTAVATPVVFTCPVGALTGLVTDVAATPLMGNPTTLVIRVDGSVTNASSAAIELTGSAPSARGYNTAGDVSFTAGLGAWLPGAADATGDVLLQPGQSVSWSSSTVTDSDGWASTITMGGSPTASVPSVWADATVAAQCADESPAMPASEAGLTAVR